MSRRTHRDFNWDEAFGVRLGETIPSADLGGSSKYSNENFEVRVVVRFCISS